MRPAAFLFFVATTALSLACATAQENPGSPLDAHAHGDDSHADLGVGSDGTTPLDVGDGAHDSAATDTSIGSDTAIEASADSAVDSHIDSFIVDSFVVDSFVDSGVDTTPDAVVVDAPPLDGGTTVVFPSTTSKTYNTATGGTTGTLGAGGGGAFFVTGTYCEQSFPGPVTVSRLDMNFRMSDLTTGCSAGKTLTWAVSLNGTKVGSYNFTSTSPAHGDRTLVESYTFAPVAAVTGSFTIRITATSTVCPGGSSWNWYPGGSATMY